MKAQWNCGMSMMGCGVRNSEMEGKVVDYTRCRSHNTLGDTTLNTNKIGLSRCGRSVWLVSLCGSGGGG